MRRLLVFATVYYLIFGYAQIAAAWLVFPAWRAGTPELLVLLVGPAAGWLVHQVHRNTWTRWIQRAVYLWVGLGFLLLFVVLPIHLLRLLGLPQGGAAVLLAAAYVPLAVWSIANAHRLVVRRIELSSPRLDRPMRLVQVSDVHVGSRGAGFLPRIVRRVNELEPDAVLVTGDLIDLRKLPADALDSMGALTAPAFFAAGNHERYIGSDAICARLEALGVTVLRNALTEWGRFASSASTTPRHRTSRPGARPDGSRHRRTRPDHVHDSHVPPSGRGRGGCARRRGPDALRAYPQRADRAVRLAREALFPPHRRALRRRRYGAVRLPRHRDVGPTMRLGSSNEITVFDLSPTPSTAASPALAGTGTRIRED